MNIPAVTRCLLRQSLISSALTHSCRKYYSFARTSWLLFKTSPRKPLRIPLQATTPLLNVTQQKDELIQHISNSGCPCSNEVSIWEDIKQIQHSPVPAMVLGFSGLIPFLMPPLCMLLTGTFHPELSLAQTAYGACVLAFMGGVRWGFVLPDDFDARADWFNLGYSVSPSFIAWAALLVSPPVSSLFIMTGLVGTAYFDCATKTYPPWFRGLRFVLTVGAVLGLWSVFMCRYLLSSPDDKLARRLAKEQYE